MKSMMRCSAAVLLSAFALTGCTTSQLESAYETCKEEVDQATKDVDVPGPTSAYMTYADDTLRLVTDDPKNTLSASVALTGAECVLRETDGPGTIADEMGQASAQSGPGKDTYDGIRVVWSYDGTDDGDGFRATFSED